jgi:branched-chain amino acid transport system ATP-binding protein
MRAVQAGARILFLDEPLAGLDSNGIEEIIKILEELKSQKVTLVIIEHIFNLPYLLDIATTLWEIKDQKIERQKITNQVNKKLAQNFQRVTPEGIPVWAKEILGESPDINHCNLWQNALLSTSAIQAQHRPILEVENLSVFRGKRLVIGQYLPGGKIEGISFSIHPHQLAVLQAPNGWGKTTLIEAIAGLIPIHQGVIRFRGKPIERLPPWERIQMGLSFLQSRDNIFSNLTVAEAFRLCKVSKIHYNSERFKNRRVSLLSGGERQKVALDCAVSKGELLILDEPFSAIDDRDVTTTFLLLKEQLRTKTILIVVPKFIDQN